MSVGIKTHKKQWVKICEFLHHFKDSILQDSTDRQLGLRRPSQEEAEPGPLYTLLGGETAQLSSRCCLLCRKMSMKSN